MSIPFAAEEGEQGAAKAGKTVPPGRSTGEGTPSDGIAAAPTGMTDSPAHSGHPLLTVFLSIWENGYNGRIRYQGGTTCGLHATPSPITR